MSRYSKDWRKISASVLQDEAYCRECATYGIKRKAKAVDHIVALSRGGTDDRANLQPLCWRHHSKKTVRDGKKARRRWLPTMDGVERDLLRIQLDTMWTRDNNGRMQLENDRGTTAAPFVAIGVTSNGERLIEIGAAVDDAQASPISTLLEKSVGLPDEDETAEVIACLDRSSSDTRVELGPTYTFLPTLPAIHLDEQARLLWSEDDDAAAHIAALPPAEREDLRPLYPTWAAVVVDGAIVSMCRTVRLSDTSAEAGVNTAREHRGRGYAAAATAHWATNMRATGRSLFYSTNVDNMSSQRVAQRLALRRIGTLWTLRAN